MPQKITLHCNWNSPLTTAVKCKEIHLQTQATCTLVFTFYANMFTTSEGLFLITFM